MNEQLEMKRIGIYLAFAFGLAWLSSLIVFFTGGLQNSPEIVPGSGITWALVLLAGPVMWSPALAHVLTRWLTREGWQAMGLEFRLRRTWPYWVAAWFLPGVLTILGGALFFVLMPQYFDSSLSVLRELIAATAPDGFDMESVNLWVIVAAQVVQAMLLAPLLNSPATFGEEFGWRAYLQPKLMPLGGRRAVLILGVIWGVWHWPIILMGHNYGLDYPGAPLLAPLAMLWFTVVLSVFLGWLTIKSHSVWPAVIGHAAINGIASLGALFVQGEPNTLLGPLPTGLIGGMGFTVVALIILASRRGLTDMSAQVSVQAAGASADSPPSGTN